MNRADAIKAACADQERLPPFTDEELATIRAERRRVALWVLCDAMAHADAAGDHDFARAIQEVVARFRRAPRG